MIPTTYTAIKSVLATDPTVSAADRARLLALLRNGGAEKPGNPPALVATEPRLLRRAEAARRLSVSLRTVDKLHAQGMIHKITLPGRKRAAGFMESDLIALITGKAGAQ